VTFSITAAKLNYIPKLSLVDNEAEFRWQLHQDTMAFEQLYEGIKVFARDGAKIKELLKEKLRE
jgi:transaldolase